MTDAAVITRFAPSPSGLLHLGHAYAAWFAREEADRAGGRVLLRIEDLDHTRCRPEYEGAIHEDLDWLGFDFEKPVMRQSERADAYAAAERELRSEGWIYPCFCTRKEVAAAIAEAGNAPHGTAADSYPGTCRRLSATEREEALASGKAACWRLDCGKALEATNSDGTLEWSDEIHGDAVARYDDIGDVVLVRKDIGPAYHLAVVVDDHEQGVTLVTRGSDLLSATPVQNLVRRLLGIPVPRYRHHGLVTDEAGKRLATRDRATALRVLREEGMTSEAVFRLARSRLAPDGR